MPQPERPLRPGPTVLLRSFSGNRAPTRHVRLPDELPSADPMTEFDTALAVAGATVVLLRRVTGYIRNRLWIAGTALCLLISLASGIA